MRTPETARALPQRLITPREEVRAMGALNNPGGYVILALAAVALALWALLGLSDWIRAQEAPAAPARGDAAAGIKKDPWGCGIITQEPGQDAA